MCQLRMLATGEFSEVGISKNIKFDVPFAAAIQNYAHYYPKGLQSRNVYFLYRNDFKEVNGQPVDIEKLEMPSKLNLLLTQDDWNYIIEELKTIQKKAYEKRLRLKELFFQNPYCTFFTGLFLRRTMKGDHPLQWITCWEPQWIIFIMLYSILLIPLIIFYSLFMHTLLSISFILDVFYTPCRLAQKSKEKEYFLNVFETHKDLDTDAIDDSLKAELDELALSLTAKFHYRVSFTVVTTGDDEVPWRHGSDSGIEHYERFGLQIGLSGTIPMARSVSVV